jgi:hypothetical protein
LLKTSYAKYLVDKFDHPVRLVVPREGLNVTLELLLQKAVIFTLQLWREGKLFLFLEIQISMVVGISFVMINILNNLKEEIKKDTEEYYREKERMQKELNKSCEKVYYLLARYERMDEEDRVFLMDDKVTRELELMESFVKYQNIDNESEILRHYGNKIKGLEIL